MGKKKYSDEALEAGRDTFNRGLSKAGLRERAESDNVLRWDGKKLFVVDSILKGNNKVREESRDVTDEVAGFIAQKMKLVGK
ncbi:MAG: hypothetical protein KDJ69_02650 [Nitratireductor sp.]|nr:hypothetical protein [Nitratireductor sp.]